jgi:cyclic pyranopterin phosphate synthase
MTGPRLTHVDETGAARMVDVSGKDVTVREATASGRVLVSSEVVALLRGGGVPKGDALGVARIAGIQAAKRTPDLVPLCHPVAIHGVQVDLRVDDDAVAIEATVRTADRTGVEMEALTCVAVAALALVDMVKAVDRAATVTDVRVDRKTGGRSGEWRRAPDGGAPHPSIDGSSQVKRRAIPLTTCSCACNQRVGAPVLTSRESRVSARANSMLSVTEARPPWHQTPVGRSASSAQGPRAATPTIFAVPPMPIQVAPACEARSKYAALAPLTGEVRDPSTEGRIE